MTNNATASFNALIADALAHPITGWDFSYVAGRYIWESPPWAYGDNVLPYIQRANAMLDVDTGGGEDLLSLYQRASRWPEECWAIEAYEPNVSIASAALAPIHVQVCRYWQDAPLPFERATATTGFDLVLNRHGTLTPKEYARILKPGGILITQQVGGEMNLALNKLLDAPPGIYSHVNLAQTVQDLQAAGFEILLTREAKPVNTFTDIGAIVWYLQSVPWQIPGFTVEGYERPLRKLHEQIQNTGPVQAQGHLFYIEAQITK